MPMIRSCPHFVEENLRGARAKKLSSRSGPATGLTDIRIGSVVIPTTPAGEMWMHMQPTALDPWLPAGRCSDGSANRSPLEGHVVIVGSSAQGLMDLVSVPREKSFPASKSTPRPCNLSDSFGPGWAR